MAEKLSEHFTLEEMIYSDTAKARGINNSPTPLHKKVLTHTCQYLLEPLRTLLNDKYKEYKGKKVKSVSIRVTSAYRSSALNAVIAGASSTSGHCKGEAVDIEAKINFTDGTKSVLPYTTLYEDIKAWVKAGKISVDQCIQEKSGNAVWVHVSHNNAGKTKDRRQFLKYNGKVYTLDVDLP